MRIENKDFWENESVIMTQDRTITSSSDYEVFLYLKALAFLKYKKETFKAKIFGCGTGREINELFKYLPIESAVATDISENMIKKCRENLINWKISQKTTTHVINATDYEKKEMNFDIVLLMNSILTYVDKKEERYKIFKNSFDILNPEGCVIGVVHNQTGSPQKTLYFMLRRIFKPFLKNEVGNRMTGFKGFKVSGFYFSKKDLYKHLSDNGFQNIEIISLVEYYKEKNYKYNRIKGYNNLLFFATKNSK